MRSTKGSNQRSNKRSNKLSNKRSNKEEWPGRGVREPETVPQGSKRTRREVLRVLAIAGGGAAAWKLGLLRGPGVTPVSRARVLMATEVRLTVIGEDREAAEAAADATLARMARLENILSRYRPQSEVARLNATGRLDQPSAPLRDVLDLAHRISQLGDGAFDITVQPVLDVYRNQVTPGVNTSDYNGLLSQLGPAIEEARARVDYRSLRVDSEAVVFGRPGMSLTLDGIGKGYIVDRGVEELASRGFTRVLVDAGGDLVAAGEREPGHPWNIGIRHPRPGRVAVSAHFEAQNQAIATSGDYMQPFTRDLELHHIIDPRTGWSAPELASATVIASTAALADGLATLVMVLGPRRGRELIEAVPDCEGYLVSKDLTITRSTGFPLA